MLADLSGLIAASCLVGRTDLETLALTLIASPHEAPTSYLSRLAARNYCDNIATFCLDLGIDLGGVSCGETAPIRHLCHLARLPVDTFDKTTIIKTTTMRYQIGSEAMDTHTLNRGEVRVCPKCVLEECEGSSHPWSIVHHLHWQVALIERCVDHGERLITLGKKNNGPERLDSAGIIRAHREEINGARNRGQADEFDIYLTDRIYGKKSGEWCDQLTIPALWRCSEALGLTLTYGKSQKRNVDLTTEQLRQATSLGFNLLKRGERSITDALTQFSVREARKRGHQPAPQYGELQRLLGRKAGYYDDLEPMRKFMREYVANRYPMAVGFSIFGAPITERRIHSMRSACRDAKIRREIVEEMLVERKIGHRGDDGLFALDMPLTVEIVEELKDEKQRFMSRDDTAKFIGASETLFKELYKSGILQPQTGKGRWERKGFDAPFLEAKMQQIFEGTSVFALAPDGTDTIARSTRVAKCSVSDILALILDGKLKAAGRLTDRFQLNDLLINEADLKAAFPARVCNGYTGTETCKRLSISFRTMHRLCDIGMLERRRTKSATSRMTNLLVTPESLADFENRYFSLGMLRRSNPAYKSLRPVDLVRLELKPVFDVIGLRRIYEWRDLPTDPIGKLEAMSLEEAAQIEEEIQ